MRCSSAPRCSPPFPCLAPAGPAPAPPCAPPCPPAVDLGAASEDSTSVGISWDNRYSYCQNIEDQSAQVAAYRAGTYQDFDCVFSIGNSERPLPAARPLLPWWGTGGARLGTGPPHARAPHARRRLRPIQPWCSLGGALPRVPPLLPHCHLPGPRAARQQRCTTQHAGGCVCVCVCLGGEACCWVRSGRRACLGCPMVGRTCADRALVPAAAAAARPFLQACARAASSTSCRHPTGAGAAPGPRPMPP